MNGLEIIFDMFGNISNIIYIILLIIFLWVLFHIPALWYKFIKTNVNKIVDNEEKADRLTKLFFFLRRK